MSPPVKHYISPSPNMEASHAEAKLVIFSVVENLLTRTGLRLKDIDILIVNCNLFSPTLSLRYDHQPLQTPHNIHSFNLSGMGCRAGLISIDLARDLLQVHANSTALVV
ncbi:hypothetical protein M5K25_025933 [Dendrobium thyrsiflorum]|uniref:FAE domain-containing protein n=1 Tax=Dendrobium thyrsiflorum TaxID=117978 RepID=A0ABD0TW09_DENTH